MQALFVENLDFVFAVYGLAFVLMAGICFLLGYKRHNQDLPWGHLGFFGIFHGINEWLDLVAILFGDSPSFSLVRLMFMSVSFIILFEAGRKSLFKHKRISIIITMHVIILSAIAFAFFAGPATVNASFRYSYGFLGATMVAAGIFSWAKREPSRKRKQWLLTACAAMAAYGVFAGLITPRSGFFPNTLLSHESFLAVVKVPVQIFRTTSALTLTLALFELYRSELKRSFTISPKFPETIGLKIFSLVMAILTIFAAIITNEATRYGENKEKNDTFNPTNHFHTDILANHLELAERVPLNIKESLSMKDIVNNVSHSKDAMNALVDRFSELIPESVVYIMNTKGETIASSNRNKPDSFVGQNYSMRPYFQDALLGKTGRFFAVGMTSKIPGYYIGVPIFDKNDNIKLVVAMKTLFSKSSLHTNSDFYSFVASPQGVVLASSHSPYRFRTLWPQHDEIFQSLITSKHFPYINQNPVFSQEPANDTEVRFAGTKSHLFRTPLPVAGWTLITVFQHTLGTSFRFIAIGAYLVSVLAFLAVSLFRQKEIERQLQIVQSEERHRAMFEENSAVMLLVDPQTSNILSMNKAAQTFYGYPPENTKILNISEIHIDSEESLSSFLKHTVTNNCSQSVSRHKLSSNTMRDVELYSTLLKNTGYNVILIIVHDISEKIRAEHEREEARSQLMRTSHLAAIGSLAAGVAHEINNPLAIISGYIDTIKELPAIQKDAEINQMLHRISDSVHRAASIIHGLLTYVMPSSNNTEQIDLDCIIKNVVETVQNHFSSLGISLETSSDNGAHRVIGSLESMEQILFNILANAKDAVENNPQGKRKIFLSIHNEEKTVVLHIRDSGPGIPLNVMDSVFTPFFSTKSPGKGTGLGLPVAQSIISAMKGTLTLQSSVGQGTLVTIRLPHALS
jgi:two-component system C4-dicarboxylate transport sensor histidine kinase DctB